MLMLMLTTKDSLVLKETATTRTNFIGQDAFAGTIEVRTKSSQEEETPLTTANPQKQLQQISHQEEAFAGPAGASGREGEGAGGLMPTLVEDICQPQFSNTSIFCCCRALY